MERGADQESESVSERLSSSDAEYASGAKLAAGMIVALIGLTLTLVGLADPLGACIPAYLTTFPDCRPMTTPFWVQVGFPALGGIMLIGGLLTARRSVQD